VHRNTSCRLINVLWRRRRPTGHRPSQAGRVHRPCWPFPFARSLEKFIVHDYWNCPTIVVRYIKIYYWRDDGGATTIHQGVSVVRTRLSVELYDIQFFLYIYNNIWIGEARRRRRSNSSENDFFFFIPNSLTFVMENAVRRPLYHDDDDDDDDDGYTATTLI